MTCDRLQYGMISGVQELKTFIADLPFHKAVGEQGKDCTLRAGDDPAEALHRTQSADGRVNWDVDGDSSPAGRGHKTGTHTADLGHAICVIRPGR